MANGCVDQTASIAASYAANLRKVGIELRVVSIPGASKAAALNAGDAMAQCARRAYLDADVELLHTALDVTHRDHRIPSVETSGGRATRVTGSRVLPTSYRDVMTQAESNP